MKKLYFILFLTFFTNSLCAKEAVVIVNGMVCEFCASTIQKNLMQKSDIVKNVKVDFDSKTVTIDFFEDKNLSDQELNDNITNNGYNIFKITI